MIIGFDGNEANVENRVGVSMYAFELLQRFQTYASSENQIRVYLRKKPLSDLPQETAHFTYKIVQGKRMWRDVFLPLSLLLEAHKPDVFFSPAHYAPRYIPYPLVVTIHDLAFLHFPDDFLKKDLYKLTNWTKDAVMKAQTVISVSEHTKKDVLAHYLIDDEKVVTVLNGLSKRPYTTKDEPNALKYVRQNSPYILYVGTLQPRKNIQTLIEAFAQIHKHHQDLKLVLVGKKGWLYDDIFKKVLELQLENHVIFTGFIADEDLPWIYDHAEIFVQPSLYEGFGLTLLEAMSYGVPCVAADGSSMNEIGQSACMYFEPTRPEDLSKKCLLILNDAQLQKSLSRAGVERSEEFSWDTCAQDTFEILVKKGQNRMYER